MEKSNKQDLLILQLKKHILIILATGDKWRDPSPQFSAWATQLHENVAEVASRWRLCAIWPIPDSKSRPAAPIALSLTATPTGQLAVW